MEELPAFLNLECLPFHPQVKKNTLTARFYYGKGLCSDVPCYHASKIGFLFALCRIFHSRNLSFKYSNNPPCQIDESVPVNGSPSHLSPETAISHIVSCSQSCPGLHEIHHHPYSPIKVRRD